MVWLSALKYLSTNEKTLNEKYMYPVMVTVVMAGVIVAAAASIRAAL